MCLDSCVQARCGDGLAGPGEECDDGNANNDDGCTVGCQTCFVRSAAAPRSNSNIMLVVDASGSMVANTWDHDLNLDTPQVTRWSSLFYVIVATLIEYGPRMNAGIQRFPSTDACPLATPEASNCYSMGACVVGAEPEVGLELDNGLAILDAIPGPDADNVEIVGGTPATGAVESSIAHLLMAEGPKYILLITDGAANCNDDLRLPALLEDYDDRLPVVVEEARLNHDITTFVVGISIVDQLQGVGPDGSPEANPFDRLNDVALAGGAPKNGGLDPEKFFNVTDQGELGLTVESIVNEIISSADCRIDLTRLEIGAPRFVEFVRVESSGQTIPNQSDCDAGDGWTWFDDSVIQLCGAYCQAHNLGEELEVVYGCG